MPAGPLLRFGVFELDTASGELRKDGVLVHLPPQPLKVLASLASRPGELVTREELKQELWGDETFVDFERGLNSCVLLVRGALGDDAQSPRFVRTVPRRGYQFLAPVARVDRNGGSPTREDLVAVASGPADVARVAARCRVIGGALVAGAVVVVLAAGFGVYRAVRHPHPPVRPMLAVLPFENLDGGGDAFADGLTEELITRLGSADPVGLGVVARTSVMRFKGAKTDVKEVARDLGVDHVLEGSVRRGDGRLRVTAQLIRASDRTHLWAATYDRAAGEALAIQDDVAARVAHAVSPRVGKPPAPPGCPTNPVAHDAYLEGRAAFAVATPEALRAAIASYEAAIAADPGFAPAHAALAEAWHVLRMRAPLPPREAYPKAEAAARRALALDPSLPAAHTALAAVLLWYHWDAAGARAELDRAIAVNPSDPIAHHDLAFLLAADDPAEAERLIRRARELDPLSPRANADVGWLLLRIRKDKDALAHCKALLEREPGFGAAQACVAQASARLGRGKDAMQEARRAHLAKLRDAARTSYVSPYALAVEEAALGDTDAALRSLSAAFEEREAMLYRIDADPAFDALRSDERFRALAKRVREAAGPPPERNAAARPV